MTITDFFPRPPAAERRELTTDVVDGGTQSALVERSCVVDSLLDIRNALTAAR